MCMLKGDDYPEDWRSKYDGNDYGLGGLVLATVMSDVDGNDVPGIDDNDV